MSQVLLCCHGLWGGDDTGVLGPVPPESPPGCCVSGSTLARSSPDPPWGTPGSAQPVWSSSSPTLGAGGVGGPWVQAGMGGPSGLGQLLGLPVPSPAVLRVPCSTRAKVAGSGDLSPCCRVPAGMKGHRVPRTPQAGAAALLQRPWRLLQGCSYGAGASKAGAADSGLS